jgi:tetraacyldisaccharide 4'-kinase
LARRCNAPMVIARDRVAAVRTLLATTPCDVIISDDGLQHYALARNVEIAVLDAQRSVGNGYCLPAGPLREPINRLARTDFCVIQGQGLTRPGAYYMQLQPQAWINLRTQQQRPLTDTFTSPLHAYAGIGNPTRFFNLLRHLGLSVHEHRFADHHAFTPTDFTDAAGTVLMTEKDAVKCAAFAKPNWWYLPVTAQCDEALFTAVCARLFPCN